jgi:hypothetical protein
MQHFGATVVGEVLQLVAAYELRLGAVAIQQDRWVSQGTKCSGRRRY